MAGEIHIVSITRANKTFPSHPGNHLPGAGLASSGGAGDFYEPAQGAPWDELSKEEASMYTIIVGGGQVGAYLASLLLAEKHQIKIIEHRKDRIAVLEQKHSR